MGQFEDSTQYADIVAVRRDSRGNLRLYRQREWPWHWLPLRQVAFHPAREWNAVLLEDLPIHPAEVALNREARH
jgi:hypothetical protein